MFTVYSIITVVWILYTYSSLSTAFLQKASGRGPGKIKAKTEGPIVFIFYALFSIFLWRSNRSLSFHFNFLGLWLCPFVRFSGFLDIPLYFTNYSIKLIYMHIIRTSSMSGLKCALLIVSAYISRVINENVRKMAKMEI